MIDLYYEQNVSITDEKRNAKKKIFLRVLKYLSILLFVFGIIFFLLSLVDSDGNFSHWTVLVFAGSVPLFSAFLFVMTLRMLRGINPEFDYIINVPKFIVVVVQNHVKRRKFLEIELSNCEEIGLVTLPSLERHLARKPKEYNCCANISDDNYYLLARINGEAAIAYFEFTQETLSTFTKVLGRNIVLKK